MISNKRVFRLYGADIVASLKRSKLKIFEWLMPEGERFKSFSVLEKAVSFLGTNSFERNDLVVALGGGVVGDLAGFAAAIYLRGISFRPDAYHVTVADQILRLVERPESTYPSARIWWARSISHQWLPSIPKLS